MGKKKKSSNKDITIAKLALITAILDLVATLIGVIFDFVDRLTK